MRSTKGTVFIQVRELLERLKREYNAEYHVAIYTSFGRVLCDLELPSTKNSIVGFADDPKKFAIDISAIFEGVDVFDDELLNVKNVIIYKNNSAEELVRTEQMILFTDQILGFSLEKKRILV
jgi:hypothetical protein